MQPPPNQEWLLRTPFPGESDAAAWAGPSSNSSARQELTAEMTTLSYFTKQARYAQSKDDNRMSYASTVLYFWIFLEHVLAVP